MVQIWVDCSNRVDLYRSVSAEIHSGANEMHLVFPRSPTAFCDEYTGAKEMHLVFSRSPRAFCGEYTQAHQLSEAFCGEYTQALMRCIQYFLEVHPRLVVNTLRGL